MFMMSVRLVKNFLHNSSSRFGFFTDYVYNSKVFDRFLRCFFQKKPLTSRDFFVLVFIFE